MAHALVAQVEVSRCNPWWACRTLHNNWQPVETGEAGQTKRVLHLLCVEETATGPLFLLSSDSAFVTSR